MRRTIVKVLAACYTCQRTKHNRFTVSGTMIPILPEDPLDTIAADVYGPLPRTSNGHKFIFAVIDIFSKYTKLYPVTKLTGEKLAKFITEDWTPTVGKPKRVLTDNATYFAGYTWRTILAAQEVEPVYTTSYYPEGNSAERVMAEVGRFMRAYCKSAHSKWNKYLPFLESCVNSTYHESVVVTPHEIIFKKRDLTFLEKIVNFPPSPDEPRLDIVRLARDTLTKMAERRNKSLRPAL